MKKVLRIIGIVLLVLIAVVAICLFIVLRRPAVPHNYTENLVTGGEIEKKYAANGSFPVEHYTVDSLSSLKTFGIWYPAQMEGEVPVVVFCNGTGVKFSKYSAVPEHLASWGFIVIGTEEEYSWYGFSAEMCVRLLEKLNSQETLDDGSINPFFGHVDMENIGISGHSQGGVAVFNAITDTRHADVYRCAFAASPANKELAHALMWDYDATQIDIPILLVASTGQADEGLVVSGAQLGEIYDDISEAPFKAAMRRKDADHGDMLYFADGYMTAFFMWQLQGDGEAGKAFTGGDAEILMNTLYQDQRIDGE